MSAPSIDLDAEIFFEKWLRAWPALQAAMLFASDGEWPALRARVGVAFEIAEACWVLSDANVREHKLLWWHEELGLLATSKSRHPLLKSAATLVLPSEMAAQALSHLHASAPTDSNAALTRVARLAGQSDGDACTRWMTEIQLAAMYLLALRSGAPSAFAQAPLDLRARFAVADATPGVALNALTSALAQAWVSSLIQGDAKWPKTHWHRLRGQRILARLGLDLMRALAGGDEPISSRWQTLIRAWWAVVGLR